MADRKREGFLPLSRQLAAILACGTAIWCLMSNVGITETIFRTSVVYLTIVIISYIVSNLVAKSISEPEPLDMIDPQSDLNDESLR